MCSSDLEGKIRYFYALSLADMGLGRSAQRQLVQVVRMGTGEPYFALALPRLVGIAEETGDDGDLARIAAKVPPEDAPPAARDAIWWLRGVRSFEAGDPAAARESLAQVSEGSTLYPRARYLSGVALQQQSRPKSAVKVFQEVATLPVRGSTEVARDANERARDLSLLNVARVNYEVGNWQTAIETYDAVPRRSVYWPEARFESAWASFGARQPNQVLGQLLTLKAPSIDQEEFVPEAPILEAITWYELCNQERVNTTIDGFDARYRPMHAELVAFLKSYSSDESKALAGEAWLHYFGPDAAETALPKSFFARLLRDGELAATARQLQAIDAEIARIGI